MSIWVLLALLLVVTGLTATGCHSNRKATVHVTVHRTGHRKTIEIPPNARASALNSGVEGVRRGTDAATVLAVFGEPFAKVLGSIHGKHETCWAYHALQAGHPYIDGLDFCLDEQQKVARIGLGVHG